MPGHPWPHSRFVPRLLSHWFGGREQQTIDGRTVAVSRSSKPSNKRGENRCFFMNPYFSNRGIWKKRRLASQTNCCNSNLCPEIRHDYPPMQSRIAWTRKLLLLLVMRGGEGEKKNEKDLNGKLPPSFPTVWSLRSLLGTTDHQFLRYHSCGRKLLATEITLHAPCCITRSTTRHIMRPVQI